MAVRSFTLSENAQRDLDSILEWTAEHFGERQAERYEGALTETFKILANDPERGLERSDLGKGLRSIHMRRPGRHFVLYRENNDVLLIDRILHDSMELSRHFPSND